MVHWIECESQILMLSRMTPGVAHSEKYASREEDPKIYSSLSVLCLFFCTDEATSPSSSKRTTKAFKY